MATANSGSVGRGKVTMKEADITIEGAHLTFAESMAVRVAVTSMITELFNNEHALGDDERGMSIREGYLKNLRSVEQKLVNGCS